MAVSDVDIKLIDSGMRALLRSGGVQSDVTRRAANVAAAAGSGYQARSTPRRTRARAEAVAATYEARRAEAKSSRLVAALSSARR
jgi:hypothetical protein